MQRQHCTNQLLFHLLLTDQGLHPLRFSHPDSADNLQHFPTAHRQAQVSLSSARVPSWNIRQCQPRLKKSFLKVRIVYFYNLCSSFCDLQMFLKLELSFPYQYFHLRQLFLSIIYQIFTFLINDSSGNCSVSMIDSGIPAFFVQGVVLLNTIFFPFLIPSSKSFQCQTIIQIFNRFGSRFYHPPVTFCFTQHIQLDFQNIKKRGNLHIKRFPLFFL